MQFVRTSTVAILVCYLCTNNCVLAGEKPCYKIEALPNSQTVLGEGPHWNIATQSLYFVDIDVGNLLRYDYIQNKVYRCKITGEELASFIIPVQGTRNKFVVGCGRRVVIVNWNGTSKTCNVERTLFQVQPEEKYKVNRFNDGKCDPRGRLFTGTMRYIGDVFAYRWGELYKYEKSGEVEIVKRDVGISNGLAWNERTRKFYYADSLDFEFKEYDYDFEKGVASNPRVVLDLHRPSTEEPLLPDGMTIDTDGNIYVAVFNGYSILKVNPRTRKVLLRITFPVKQITSAAFGGPNLDILYVTSAALFGEQYPAGTTYKVTGLGAKGLPMTKFPA